MANEFLKGKTWSAKKVDQVYIVSVQNTESILDALTDFVLNQNITSGQITGIGAASEATLRFFDPIKKEYQDQKFDEQLEISNLTGNISLKDEKPLLHLHVTLSRQDFTALAGHLLDARIKGAGEFYILPINTSLTKKMNTNIGVNLYDFEE